MRRSSTIKMLSVVAVITVAVYAGVVMLFLHTKQISATATERAAEVARQEKQRQEFETVREMVQNNSDEMERLASYFVQPDTAGTAAFLNKLESLSDISGAGVTTESVEVNSGGTEDLPRVDLRLTSSGSWPEVYHTVALLETLPYDIRIGEAQLSAGGGSATSTWNVRINLSAAKLKEVATSTRQSATSAPAAATTSRATSTATSATGTPSIR